MRDAMHNEIHVFLTDNGHVQSTDCWCEPTDIKRIRNKHGVDALLIEHHDFTLAPHVLVVAAREQDKSLPYLGQFVEHPLNRSLDAPWITRALAPFGDPPLLPPHDPHERSL